MASTAHQKMRGRVCVVGAGVIGLASAVAILESTPDADVTVVAEKFSPKTTSNLSGGYYNPRFAMDNVPLHKLQKWTQATWKHLLPLTRSTEAAKIGTSFVPGYRLFLEKNVDVGDPWWKDIVISCRKVSQKEIEQIFPDFKDGYAYITILTTLDLYLPYLLNRFQEKGGKIIQRRMGSLAEFIGQYDVVVNCSGLGARYLANDAAMVPLKGQILRIRAPMQKFFYCCDFTPNMEVKEPNRLFHAFPSGDVVIVGGTRERGDWNTTPDPEITREIMERAVKVLPNLKGSEVVSADIGLRADRIGGLRMEAETMHFGSQTLEVVHNYGHDGGFTLHWGCAVETAELVRRALRNSPPLPPHSRL